MHRRLGQIEIGNRLVQKVDQAAHQPAFGLPLLAQEQHVVLGQERQVDLGDDRVFVPDDAGEQLFARGQFTQQVIVDFALDGFRLPAAFAKLAEIGRTSSRLRHRGASGVGRNSEDRTPA